MYKNGNIDDDPIRTKEEADKVYEYLVRTTVVVLKIDEGEAKLRVRRLLDSKELDGLLPDNVIFQMTVDKYMTTPSNMPV